MFGFLSFAWNAVCDWILPSRMYDMDEWILHRGIWSASIALSGQRTLYG